MRSTLIIPDPLYGRLKQRAAETGKTISGLVSEFVRGGLEGSGEASDLEPLPTFSGGRLLVDPDDREALHEALDRDRDRRLYGGGEG